MERVGDTGAEVIARPESECRRCGATVVGVVVGNSAIPLPYCPACAADLAAEALAVEKARELERALDKAGRTPHLRDLTIESHPLAEQRAVAVEWLEAYRAGERRNLWLYGPAGSGKTGLAWGLVRALTVASVEAYYALPEDDRHWGVPHVALLVVWRDLYDDLVASFRASREMDHEAVADPRRLLSIARKVPVLALDDLGAGRETPTPYALEQLEILVDRRYQADLTTIVTSNLSTGELATQLGLASDIAADRIVTRLLEGAVREKFPDARLRLAAR
jgi:DNA replication protein DnaC